MRFSNRCSSLHINRSSKNFIFSNRDEVLYRTLGEFDVFRARFGIAGFATYEIAVRIRLVHCKKFSTEKNILIGIGCGGRYARLEPFR